MFCNSAVAHELILHHKWGKDFLISTAVSSHEKTNEFIFDVSGSGFSQCNVQQKGTIVDYALSLPLLVEQCNYCKNNKEKFTRFFISREAAQTIVKAIKNDDSSIIGL